MSRWLAAALVVWMAPSGLAQSFSFHPAVSYPAENGSLATVSADFNADGNLDLAVGNAGSASISIFFGDGSGSFIAGPTVAFGSACAVSYLSAGDFNGDGKPDLLAVCGFQTAMWVALNTGSGDFGTPQVTALPQYAYQGFGVFTQFQTVAVADFDHDGKLDVALALGPRFIGFTWGLYLFAGDGNGAFRQPVQILPQTLTQPIAVAQADLNGDGNPDLAVALGQLSPGSPGPGALAIFLGDGHGSFHQQPNPYALSGNLTYGSLSVADLDADGIPDIAIDTVMEANSKVKTSVLQVFKGLGDGSFQQVFTNTGGHLAFQLQAGEFRGNGKLDLMETVVDPGSNVYLLQLRASNGDGTFQTAVPVPVTLSQFPWLFNISIGDWNNDGLPDVAFPYVPAGNVGGSTGSGNDDVTVVSNAWETFGPGGLGIMLNALPLPPPIITSVVNGASFKPGIESGSWVTVFGFHLASDSRPWTLADFNGNNLPLALDGTSATIDGKSAAVYYINSGQLDVQAPTDSATGPVSVVVTHNGLMSQPFTAQLQNTAPAFFLYSGTNYAIASHLDFSLVGNPAVIPGTTPAQPNEPVILWGTGFGPTDPATPAGVLFSGAPAATNLPAVTVNAQAAANIGTVLSPGSVGLYQVAIQLPASLPAGPVAIRASLGGEQSPTGVLIFISNP